MYKQYEQNSLIGPTQGPKYVKGILITWYAASFKNTGWYSVEYSTLGWKVVQQITIVTESEISPKKRRAKMAWHTFASICFQVKQKGHNSSAKLQKAAYTTAEHPPSCRTEDGEVMFIDFLVKR